MDVNSLERTKWNTNIILYLYLNIEAWQVKEHYMVSTKPPAWWY